MNKISLYYYILLNSSRGLKHQNPSTILSNFNKTNQFLVYSSLYQKNILFFGGNLQSNIILSGLKRHSTFFKNDVLFLEKWKPGFLSNVLEFKNQKKNEHCLDIKRYPYITYSLNYLDSIYLRKESSYRNQINISLLPDFESSIVKSKQISNKLDSLDYKVSLQDSKLCVLNTIASSILYSKMKGFISRLDSYKLKRKLMYIL